MNFLMECGEILNIHNLIPYNWYFSEAASLWCSLLDGWLCEIVYSAFQGKEVGELENWDKGDVYLSHMPTDAGSFNFIHFGQLIHTSEEENGDGLTHFRRFDYGEKGNMKRYNQTIPPDYEISNIKFPIAIFYGSNDDLANPKDVAYLYDHIKDTVIHYEEVNLGHLSF